MAACIIETWRCCRTISCHHYSIRQLRSQKECLIQRNVSCSTDNIAGWVEDPGILNEGSSGEIPGDCMLQTGGFGGPGEDGGEVGAEVLIVVVEGVVDTGGGLEVVEVVEGGREEPGAEEAVQGDCRRLWRRASTTLSLERKSKTPKMAIKYFKCCIFLFPFSIFLLSYKFAFTIPVILVPVVVFPESLEVQMYGGYLVASVVGFEKRREDQL
ncbi:hypothetical protein BPAE_0066g00080 [Botrytis paeoniae]|uniref:Uncharacterized protein n=1 Tax=Botrytis paeoniae TaxID=278948 RepID=A0A4Z1FT10_9HELO|nr:hypothetical protein BPAE_0066g00080 [Botrytis paeoniae]